MTIAELTELMRRSRPVDEVFGSITPKRLSDVLRAQVASGRVRRVRRGTSEAVPLPMGRTTAWRYDRWELQFDRLADRQGRLSGIWPRPQDRAEHREIIRAHLRAWAFEVGRFFDGISADSTDEEIAAVASGCPVFEISSSLAAD